MALTDKPRPVEHRGVLKRGRRVRPIRSCSPGACNGVRSETISVTEGDILDTVLDTIDRDVPPAYPYQSSSDTDLLRLSAPIVARDDDKKPSSPPPVVNQDREHLLIAAGAIGAFILFCFIGWVVYRMLRKSGKLGGPPGMPLEASPWAMRNGKYTQYPPSEPPSMYDKAELVYGGEQMYSRADLQSRSSYAYSGGGTLRRQAPGMPPNGQFTMPRNDELPQTADDRAIEQYYNELFSSQPPAAARDPAQRQYRMSDVSSLSSGFGDGEFVVTQPLPAPPRVAQSSAPSQRESGAYSRPPSWASQGDRGERRETIYTTTSEDRPARFRTLSSWVNQQSGRVRRADSRAQERGEIPVMPAVPGEMSFIRQTAYR